MPKYRCIRRCYHGKHLYAVGEMAVFPEKEAPRHFVPVEEFSEKVVQAAEVEDNQRRAKNPPKIKAERAPAAG